MVALLDFTVQDISSPLVVQSINHLLSPMACQTLDKWGKYGKIGDRIAFRAMIDHITKTFLGFYSFSVYEWYACVCVHSSHA